MEALLCSVHEEAWDGFIPIEFSMDASEVTSLQRPLPLYVSFLFFAVLFCRLHVKLTVESLSSSTHDVVVREGVS